VKVCELERLEMADDKKLQRNDSIEFVKELLKSGALGEQTTSRSVSEELVSIWPLVRAR
jgi:hypothetical protein